jgi:hypothetical protein
MRIPIAAVVAIPVRGGLVLVGSVLVAIAPRLIAIGKRLIAIGKRLIDVAQALLSEILTLTRIRWHSIRHARPFLHPRELPHGPIDGGLDPEYPHRDRPLRPSHCPEDLQVIPSSLL